MSGEEFNNVSIAEAIGPKALDLGGAGTGFDKFDQHMGAVGVAVTQAPGTGLSHVVSDPKNDFAAIIKPQTLGR